MSRRSQLLTGSHPWRRAVQRRGEASFAGDPHIAQRPSSICQSYARSSAKTETHHEGFRTCGTKRAGEQASNKDGRGTVTESTTQVEHCEYTASHYEHYSL